MASPLREAFRASARDRIKAIARARLDAEGPSGISLRAIASEMGVTAPSLYRYYGSRDALITALVTDGYASLAEALAAVAQPADPVVWLEALADGYRAWALASPSRFLLLFGTPIPGYDATGSRTTQAAARAWAPFIAAIAQGFTAGEFRFCAPSAALASALAADPHLSSSPAPVAAGSLTAWAHLHGAVMLELTRQTTFLNADEELFASAKRCIVAGLRGGWAA
jgi:AcrR family transcriptional regulator